ncbi:nucleotide disphospho-sugar-binding domain-containing protein [Arthrobacter globiformis]|uniref:nucleotide disphospho-sugar-binding domain-containing protein n=1 Tax=Arthrobacter globiformis TaxID=1665 RepID=UPI0027D8B467|nr:nucleotide disphospho-sugar-binding domain-containing protein [Arthrobacter globiformis]
MVVSTGQTDPALLGPLPANVLASRFVPQLEVLARAALFVTHGGMNSVNEAMYAGVPMLVIPQGAEQPLVAGRVAESGAGLSIRAQDALGAERAEALEFAVLLILEKLSPTERAAYVLREAFDYPYP